MFRQLVLGVALSLLCGLAGCIVVGPRRAVAPVYVRPAPALIIRP